MRTYVRDKLPSLSSRSQSVQPQISPFRLLALPIELRLSIYREVIMSSIIANQIHTIQGLFLSCRQVHHEMEDNYISKARPLLNVMHDLQSTSEATESISLQFSDHESFTLAIQISMIQIPTAILPSRADTMHNPEPWRTTIEGLRKAFRLPHSTLSVRVIGRPYRPIPSIIGQFYWMAYCLHAFDDGEPAFSKIDRLILQTTDHRGEDLNGRMRPLHISMYHPELGGNPFPQCVRSWVAGTGANGEEGTLSFGFDYVVGLPSFEERSLTRGVVKTVQGWSTVTHLSAFRGVDSPVQPQLPHLSNPE
jgi:hypothetical protein